MLRVYLFGLCILVSTFLNAKPADALDSSSESDLGSLIQILDKIRTFSGSFVQYSLDQKGVRIQESHGQLKAERSGNFYWHTDSPLEQTVISDGTHVTVYDPDLEQATIQNVDANLQTTPAVLFSGDITTIGSLFEVELKKFNSSTSQFLLTPKTKDSLFEILRVRFEGLRLKELRITDSLGQESTMSFVHSEINLDFPPETFVALLPDGTDIIKDVPNLSSTKLP